MRLRLCPTAHRCTGPTSAPLAEPHPATVPRSRGPTHPTGLLQPRAVAASRRAPASASPAPSSSSDSSSGHLPSRTPPAPLPHCTRGGSAPALCALPIAAGAAGRALPPAEKLPNVPFQSAPFGAHARKANRAGRLGSCCPAFVVSAAWVAKAVLVAIEN